MSPRLLALVSALALLLAPSSRAALFVAPPASSPPTPENAGTAFFEASETRIGLLCHNDPINKNDPFGLASVTVELKTIWRKSLDSNIPHPVSLVKIAVNGLVNGTKSDHVDRSQAVYKDGGLSKIGLKQEAAPSYTSKGFIHDHYIEQFPVQKDRPLAFLLHVHDDVRPGNSTTNPQVPGEDANAVIKNQVPMIFTSTSQYPNNNGSFTGSLVTPNGTRQPTVNPLQFDW